MSCLQFWRLECSEKKERNVVLTLERFCAHKANASLCYVRSHLAKDSSVQSDQSLRVARLLYNDVKNWIQETRKTDLWYPKVILRWESRIACISTTHSLRGNNGVKVQGQRPACWKARVLDRQKPETLSQRKKAMHIPVLSMLLYAHAAAGPEYEYPACLVPFNIKIWANPNAKIWNGRSYYCFAALDRIWFLRFSDLLQPFGELRVEVFPCDRLKLDIGTLLQITVVRIPSPSMRCGSGSPAWIWFSKSLHSVRRNVHFQLSSRDKLTVMIQEYLSHLLRQSWPIPI